MMDWHWIHACLHDSCAGAEYFTKDHAGNLTEQCEKAKLVRAQKSRNAGD